MKKVIKKYKFAVIATDAILFRLRSEKLEVLLIKMNKDPFKGKWAAPGGLVDADESVDTASRRVLREKTGLENIYQEQLYTFGDVDRDPFGRVVSVAYLALMQRDAEIKTTDDHKEIAWFDIKKLPKLAYDHQMIIQTAIDRLRAKLEYTSIIYHLLSREFTMSEMQRAYELILDRKLDKRNFQKKIHALGLVSKTGKMKKGEASRPAALYRFKNTGSKVIQIL